MNSQYRKNLKDLATACKNYVDETKEQILWQVGQYDITTQDDNTTTYQKVVPTGATRCKIKRIYGLTQKFNPTTASDSTSYSVKIMPAIVYNFDISKVEGNSEKSENLLVLNDVVQTTTSGITYSISNGVIKLNGTASARVQLYFNTSVPKGTISINYFNAFTLGGGQMSVNFRDSNQNLLFYINSYPTTNITQTNTITEDIGELYINIVAGTTLTNAVLKPMIVKGSTAPTDFKQGYTGIHNFAWTGVKVEGSNLFDNANTELTGKTFSGANQTVYSYSGFAMKVFNLVIGKTYTITSTKDMRLGFTDDITNSGTYQQTNNYTFTASTSYLLITNRIANEYADMFENLMLNYGSTALTYTPYITPTTTTIDLSSILYNGSPLFDNGLCGVNDVKDSVTPYKATKKLGYVDLGTLTWNYANGRMEALLSSIKDTSSRNADLLCANYNSSTTGNDKDIFTVYKQIIIYDSAYDDATTFKTAMSGVYLVYELATPIEVSINWALLLRGITGYSNGTISLLNTNNQDTANLITYNSIIKENCCAKMVQSRGGNVVKTINLPTQVSDGYSAVSVANIRDFTTNKRETNVDKNSDLGGFTWGYTGQYFWSTDIQSLVKTPQDNSYAANAECKSYSNYPSNNLLGGNLRIAIQSGGSVVVNDTRYDSNTTFKTAMTNEPLYYELADASKTSTDITPIENVLEVQPNDTLAFYDANDNLVTVPSDLTYRIEVAK